MNTWQTVENKLQLELKFKNYTEALDFVNRLSVLAEAANHHPDISFGWGYVKINLFSHDTQSITDRDHKLAEEINTLL